jgi:hypothetical protein
LAVFETERRIARAGEAEKRIGPVMDAQDGLWIQVAHGFLDSAKTKAASRLAGRHGKGDAALNPWSGITRNPLFYRARCRRAAARRLSVVKRVTGPGSAGAGHCDDRRRERHWRGCSRASARVRRWAKATQGGCHRLSGMRRIGAPRGQHFQDDTETCPALQH